MRNPQVYVLALIAKGDISLHAWLKIANQNGQCRIQCSLAFLICVICACAYLLPVLRPGATSGVLLKKVGF